MTVGIALQLPEVFLARELLLPTISSQNISLLCLLSQEVIAASRVLSCCEDGSAAKGVKGRGRCLTPDLATNHRALKIFPGRKVPGSLMLCLVLSWRSCWPGAFGGPLVLSLSRIYDVRYMVSSGVSQCQSLRRWSPPYLSSCGIINPIFLSSALYFLCLWDPRNDQFPHSGLCCPEAPLLLETGSERGAEERLQLGVCYSWTAAIRCASVTGDPSPLRTVTQFNVSQENLKNQNQSETETPSMSIYTVLEPWGQDMQTMESAVFTREIFYHLLSLIYL